MSSSAVSLLQTVPGTDPTIPLRTGQCEAIPDPECVYVCVEEGLILNIKENVCMFPLIND